MNIAIVSIGRNAGVDGNDYYICEALAEYRPRVVVVEINPAHPPPQRWAIAYNPEHTWQVNATSNPPRYRHAHRDGPSLAL